MKGKGWIAVDLDGTLARYDSYNGPSHIGDPIPGMVERVKVWLREDKDVRIFTARVDGGSAAVAMGDAEGEKFRDVEAVKKTIREWCVRHIGCELPITNVKDYAMTELWDDRAVSVSKNGECTVADLLVQGGQTFKERNALYKNNYKEYGRLLLALFPDQKLPTVTNPDDASRLNLIMDCLGKLQRYAYNFERGGHKDSAHDLMVYAAMLEEATK